MSQGAELRTRRRAASLLPMLLLLPVAACVLEDRTPPARGPNVLLISIDTLRADHLGCYGYPRGTSPNLDAFARDAVLFERAISHAPSTLPAHAAIFSSRIPTRNGAFWTREQALAREVRSVTELLRDAGFATAGFHGGGQVAAEFGLGRGFDVYEPVCCTFLDTVRRAGEWLGDGRDRPFFLFLHTYHVHHPYTPARENLARFDSGYAGNLPNRISIDLLKQINGVKRERRPIDAEDLQHIVDAYDGEISEMDSAFGFLAAVLERRGLYADLLIVFTSDHGEEFAEHGVVGWHGDTLYDEQIHVPLIWKLPGGRGAGRRVSEQVRGIDIAPTLLELAGLEPEETFDGRSLLASLYGNPGGRERLAISQRDHKREPPDASIRSSSWKLYEGRLFDLVNDPREQTDVASEHPPVVAWLERALERGRRGEQVPTTPAGELPEPTLEQLRSLGYIE